MAPKNKAAAKKGTKRSKVAAEEESAPSTPLPASGSAGETVVASAKDVLDVGDIKRFKSHAGYAAAKSTGPPSLREYATKALDLYANGTTEQKNRVLQSFKSDKGYKWATTFHEDNSEKDTDKDQFVGGWMTKFDVAKALNIPTVDKDQYQELADAAVEGHPSKPHPSQGLANKGIMLYNMPEFQVSGNHREHASSRSKSFKSETDLTASQVKKLGQGEEVHIKLEHPEFVSLQQQAKLVHKGHALMSRSLNSGRAVSAKMKLYTRTASASALAGVAAQFENFNNGMGYLENMELDVLSLMAMCKEVEKDDKDSIAELKHKCECALTNGKHAVQDFEALRERIAKLI